MLPNAKAFGRKSHPAMGASLFYQDGAGLVSNVAATVRAR